MSKKETKSDLPVIGEEYYFYDDGKINLSRQYRVLVTKVVPYAEGCTKLYRIDKEDVSAHLPEHLQDRNAHPITWGALFDLSAKEYKWIFSKTTDYFVEAEYIENNPSWNTEKPYKLLFARSHGGFYTIDPFFNGRLDVTGSLTETLFKEES